MASSTASAWAPSLAVARRELRWTPSTPTTSSSIPTLTTSTQESRPRTAGRRPCLSPPVPPPARSSSEWAWASTPGSAR
eukprot:13097632-Alexandrium_andersonii.AAC.1